MQHGFDYYVRSVTAALLALGIFALAGFELVHDGHLPEPLATWAGTVVGLYLGAHAVLNGRKTVPPPSKSAPPSEGE